MGEFDLIARIAASAGTRADVELGIGDDAAILRFAPDERVVVAVDTLVAGVHFPQDTAAEAIGHKALAVNLSDLAAMGAEPRFALWALSMPGPDRAYAEGLLAGLCDLARLHDVALVGGDTTRGPLSLSITVLGAVPPGLALTRHGAREGDLIYISGHPGEAAAALALRDTPATQPESGHALAAEKLRRRLDRPTPRVALGLALRGIASACIDVSDGLLADLGHIAARSGLAALIDPELLPLSLALRTAIPAPARQRELVLSGGDDYELCFSAAPERAAAITELAARLNLPLTRIGQMGPGSGVWVYAEDGSLRAPQRRGYEHFA